MSGTNFEEAEIPIIDITGENYEPHSKRQKLNVSCTSINNPHLVGAIKSPSENEYLVLPDESVDKNKFFENVLDYFDDPSPLPDVTEHGMNRKGDLKDTLECMSKALCAEATTEKNIAQLSRMVLNPKAVRRNNIVVSRPQVTVDVPPKLLDNRLKSGSLPKTKGDLQQDVGNLSPKLPGKMCCVVECLVRRFTVGVNGISSPIMDAENCVKRGRPMPEIPSLGVSYNFYRNHSWVTGCPTLQKLFCWPCLLFNRKDLKFVCTVWIKEGFDTVSMLVGAMTKHANTITHKASVRTLDQVNHRMFNTGRIQVITPKPLTMGVGEENLNIPEKPVASFPNSTIATGNGLSQTGEPTTLREEVRKNSTRMENSSTKTKMLDNTIKPLRGVEPKRPEQTISSPVSVKILQLKHFVHGDWAECQRAQIIAAGRPKPDLPQMSQNVGGFVRCLNVTYYEKIPWLCGSAEFNRVYCWPCLLFNRHNNNADIWNTVGFNNLANLIAAARNHSLSHLHLEASIRLKRYEQELKKKNQPLKPHPDHPRKIDSHNIDSNKREVLKCLIDCICFKKKQINNTNLQCEDYDMFLKILCCYDTKLANYFNPNLSDALPDVTDFVRKYFRTTVSSLENILKRKVTSEVKNAAFVSMILRSIRRNTVALILRYVTNTGEVRETFFDFIKIGFGLCEVLKAQITSVAKELSLDDKFVGISYDGGLLKPNQTSLFNNSLLEDYPSAHFFLYRHENIKLLLQQSLSNSPQCRLFFHLVQELGIFLEDNPKVMHFVSQNGMDNGCASNWNLGPWFLITLYEQYPVIVKLLDNVVNQTSSGSRTGILGNRSKESVDRLSRNTILARSRKSPSCQHWSNHVISQCAKFKIFLDLDETKLLVVLISKVFFILHSLTEAMMSEFDPKSWYKTVDDTLDRIMKIRTRKFENVCHQAENITGTDVKFRKDRQTLVTIYDKTLDWIVTFLTARTKNIDVWSFFTVGKSKIDIPISKGRSKQLGFHDGLKEYFPLFDSSSLGSSLTFACNHSLFMHKPPETWLKTMDDLELNSVLPDLRRFLLLLLAVPMSSANVKSPASERLVTYATDKSELNSADVLFYVDSDLLSALQKESWFHAQVIKTISELEGHRSVPLQTKTTKITYKNSMADVD